MNRQELVSEIERRKLSAIIRTRSEEQARRGMRAAVEGGFTFVEFTLNTPGACRLIAEFSRESDLLVGAGTVLTPEEARSAVEAGARFLVSPVFDPAVVAAAQGLGVPSIPGTSTPTEMMAAHRAGADFVKLFPAPSDIARYVTQIRGPMPFLRIFPTAGIDEENFGLVLRAGAAGVGFVSSLFRREELEAGNYEAIRARAGRILAEARSSGVFESQP